MWAPLKSEFVGRLEEVNAHLAKFNLPAIEKGNALEGNRNTALQHVEGGKVEGSEAKVNGKH